MVVIDIIAAIIAIDLVSVSSHLEVRIERRGAAGLYNAVQDSPFRRPGAEDSFLGE